MKEYPTNEEMLRTLRAEYEKGVADTIAKYEQKEQKPAEWAELQSEFKNINEAFEDGKKEVIAHPEKYGLCDCKPSECGEQKEQNLIMANSPQLKWKWDEDDEQYLLICKNALQKYQHSDQWDANIISNWLEERLKSSFRPQPHTVSIKDATKFGNLEYERGVKDGIESEKNRQWKPSEHQMTILKAVKEYVGRGSGYWGESLGSLIEDLEKLI
jgi:hypothetical protein